MLLICKNDKKENNKILKETNMNRYCEKKENKEL